MKHDLEELKRQYVELKRQDEELEIRQRQVDERLDEYRRNRQLLLGVGRLQENPFELQREKAAQREWAYLHQQQEELRKQQKELLKKCPWWVRIFRRNEW